MKLKKEQLKVSVIITNYNYAQYVREAIESVLNQSYQNFEIIVVDDGSTDESATVLRNYEESYADKITVISQKNGGQASAFNTGFEKATGDIVAFLDADDYWYENKLSTIVKYHEKYDGIQHNLLINNEIPFVLLEDQVGKQRRLLEEYGFFGTIPTSGLSFTYEKLKKVFPIPTEYKICADLYMKMFFLNEGNEIFSLNGAFANYRHHDNNLWFNNQSLTISYNEITLNYINKNRYRKNKKMIYRINPAKMYTKAGLDLRKINDSTTRIGIYGMGAIAQELYLELIAKDYSVTFFTDSGTESEGTTFNGLPVIPFRLVAARAEDYDLLIIASSAQTEIIAELKKKGFPKDKYIGLYL
ncbi:glycosyltransferase involved in cell wall biosynthesis [Sporosarcina luteola]|nr:glycosyltransferase involved in cell wall biosynthesis [Sporosarcina luteola]